MAFLFAILVLSPFFYTAKNSENIAGSVTYEGSASKNSFRSNNLSAYGKSGDFFLGVYGSQSEEKDTEDSQTNEFGGYLGYVHNEWITFTGTGRRTREPSSIVGKGLKGNISAIISELWEGYYFTTLNLGYGVFYNDSDIRDETGVVVVEENTNLEQRYFTVGLEQDISESLIVGATITNYSYRDKSQQIITGTTFSLLTSVDGILGFPTTDQSYYFVFYPSDNWDFTYTHGITRSIDVDDSSTDDFRLGYTINSAYRVGGVFTVLKTDNSSNQHFYGLNLSIYF